MYLRRKEYIEGKEWNVFKKEWSKEFRKIKVRKNTAGKERNGESEQINIKKFFLNGHFKENTFQIFILSFLSIFMYLFIYLSIY